MQEKGGSKTRRDGWEGKGEFGKEEAERGEERREKGRGREPGVGERIAFSQASYLL